jgi:methylated-DNA-[protein]-cysteine S-methyltransferase
MNDPTTKSPGRPAAPALRAIHLDTPVGRLTVVAGPQGLRAVLWPEDDPARVVLDAEVEELDGVVLAEEDVLRRARQQLVEYFAGERIDFDLPLDPVGTPFQQRAWAVLRTIPYGTTITYGEQARRLGAPTAARAVGAANGRNPLSVVVPCHRVTGADGRLTGFAGGLDAKAWLLDHEREVLSRRPAPR